MLAFSFTNVTGDLFLITAGKHLYSLRCRGERRRGDTGTRGKKTRRHGHAETRRVSGHTYPRVSASSPHRVRSESVRSRSSRSERESDSPHSLTPHLFDSSLLTCLPLPDFNQGVPQEIANCYKHQSITHLERKLCLVSCFGCLF